MPDSIAPLSILLIEDEPADSTLLKVTLRDEIQRGAVIIQTVRKFKPACEELKRFGFTCVLMDLGLPDGVGAEGVTRLHAVDPEVAVILLTGFNDEKTAQRALELGAQDYLVKGGYDGHDLLRLIRHAVVRHQRLRKLLRGVAA